MAPIGKVHVHNSEEDHVGYVRVDTDQIGNVIGEVYTEQADRIGAIRYEPMKYEPKESLIHNEEGARVGYVRLVRDAEGNMEATVFVLREAGTEAEAYGYLHQNMIEEQRFVLRNSEGEALGWLDPEEEVSDELAILIGGAAGLLLLA